MTKLKLGIRRLFLLLRRVNTLEKSEQYLNGRAGRVSTNLVLKTELDKIS